MTFVVAMFLIGLLLSGFFSGTETGFYRATRTRLALDALSGNPLSRGLIWLTNNPAMFVATTLVGNNLANYTASWAVVLGTSRLAGGSHAGVDLVASILSSPIIFIYGELLPKYVFFRAPNRLLHAASPVFFFFTAIFSPLAAVLWCLGRIIESVIGVSPEKLQLKLVRSELRRVFSEGHAVGVLQRTQRQLAEGMFQVAALPLDRFCRPLSRLAVAPLTTPRAELLRIAYRLKSPVIFVPDHRNELTGYLRVIDFHFHADSLPNVRKLPRVHRRESLIAALTLLREQDQVYAAVIGDNGRVQGVVDTDDIAEAMLTATTQ